MKLKIQVVDNNFIEFDLSVLQYQVKNNILANRTRKGLKLCSSLIKLDVSVLPTSYTKFVEVYTADGQRVEISQEIPTKLTGDYKFIIKKKTIDLKKTKLFKSVNNPKIKLDKQLLFENLEISSNSHFKTVELRRVLTSGQNIIHYGSEFQFPVIQSNEINIDLQELIILESILGKNPLRYSKYIVLELTAANSENFFGSNQEYFLKILNAIAKHLSIFIYTDLTVDSFDAFSKYERIATAVLYKDTILLEKYIAQKTKTLKLDANKQSPLQIEYVLNDLAKRNIVTTYQSGIEVHVNDFSQIIQAIIGNLNECLSNSKYLNIQTDFELTIEQLNVISSFNCPNILVNSKSQFEQKSLNSCPQIVLTASYPKYNNADKTLIEEYLKKNHNESTVVFTVDSVNPQTCVIDGHLVIKMTSQALPTVFNCFDSLDVVGVNNDIIDVLHQTNSKINYQISGFNQFTQPRLDVFARQMWKIIGMPNLQFNFEQDSDLEIFNQQVNVKQLEVNYTVNDIYQSQSGNKFFEMNEQAMPIIIDQVANQIKILKDGAFIITYHNDLSINTIQATVEQSIVQLTNKTLIHLPAGTILDCNRKSISIYCTGTEYSPNEFKKYRNEMIVNSTLSDEYIEDPQFALADSYTNYGGVYIHPSASGQMFATNITLTNKNYLTELYQQLVNSDKLIYVIIDEQMNVTNIISTYNVISNLKLSVLCTQDDVYQVIKENQLWKYCEVIR